MNARASQRVLLLSAFAHKHHRSGLTAEEAADYADLYHPGICFWKRVSEMVKDGYLAPLVKNGKTQRRTTMAGGKGTVYVITPEGRDFLKQARKAIKTTGQVAA